jgi:dTDP-4-dehydrorhamnose reductase
MLVGAGGQVGRACAAFAPADVELVPFGHADLDITDATRVTECVASTRPAVIINAAAYTAVDKAESDADNARRANALGPRNLAAALARLQQGRLLHISTDFVFDGAASKPYSPEAATGPLGVYGRTKLEGELAVRELLGERATIVRTAWVYAATGSNFVLTMLRHMAKGGVRVVADQVGTPTSAKSLASALWVMVAKDIGGVFHWSDAGVASWYDFAVAIAEEAVAGGLLDTMPNIHPISTSDYPTPARRPAYSVLDKSRSCATFGLMPAHWRVRLREVIGEIRLP